MHSHFLTPHCFSLFFITILAMASTTFTLDIAMKSLDEGGFFDLEDSATGEFVDQMERKGFPFVSDYGLNFCKERVLDDQVSFAAFPQLQLLTSFKRIKSIVEAILKECSLAHWLRYKAYPEHIVCFRAGGINAGRRSLLVQLWANGSHAKYYSGSHLHDLPKKEGARRLWEIEPSALAKAGCAGIMKRFPHGGL